MTRYASSARNGDRLLQTLQQSPARSGPSERVSAAAVALMAKGKPVGAVRGQIDAQISAVISSPIFDVFAVYAVALRPRRGQVIYSSVSAAPKVMSPT
jgi:hypothetical protein